MRLIDADELPITETWALVNNDNNSPEGISFAPLKCVLMKDINNAPTVLHDNYSMGYQDGVKQVMSKRLNGGWHLDIKASNTIKFNKIKALIDNWAVDDDEHALLERIAYIVSDTETEDEDSN